MRRGFFFAVFLIIFIIILVVVGFKGYLMFNFLIGNDLRITLQTENENLFLENGNTTDIEFKTYVKMNPFCKSHCTSELIDVSRSKSSQKRDFQISSINPETEKYTLEADTTGKGQKIYYYQVSCISEQSMLCHTQDYFKTESKMITLNHDLNQEEKQKKNSLTQEIKNNLEMLIYFKENINEFNKTLPYLENHTNTDTAKQNIDSISNLILVVNNSNTEIINAWNQGNYDEIKIKRDESEIYYEQIENKFSTLNTQINSSVKTCNSVLIKITNISTQLKLIENINSSQENVDELNRLIRNYNNALIQLPQKGDLNVKQTNANTIDTQLKDLIANINSETDECCSANETISTPTLSQIPLNYIPKRIITFNLSEQKEICCIERKCEECCDSSCYSDDKEFPLILLHGHGFSSQVSAETSLMDLIDLQNTLSEQTYLDGGKIITAELRESSLGIWGNQKKRISVRTSYYFDAFVNSEQSTSIETKTDNIDTYALRLKDIIEGIKLKTNREKVDIVAHSMGGLVVRKYLEIFGEDSVNTVILVGTPNHGIEDDILEYCQLFGGKAECRDMSKNSLFINKLENTRNPQKVKFYNIIGIGCDMKGKNGDGIVTNESAYLEFAENYYIQGNCDNIGINTLHTSMINTARYPEIKQIILNALNNETSA